MLTGSLLGALGGVGLAKGFNLMRGEKEAAVTWSDDFLVGLAQPYVLTYLAVAHYGRGRGQWRESELPDFWRPEVASVLEARRERLHAMFAERTDAGDQTQLATTLGAELETVTREIVERLYPGSQRAFRTDS